MIYPLVREMAASPDRIPVAVACRVLGFSEQGYYKWKRQPVSAREQEDQRIITLLRALHADDPQLGYRFLADELAAQGVAASERRVWRLCHLAGIKARITRGRGRYKKAGPVVHDDLICRDFTADGPIQRWLTDITEHPTDEGKLYVCAIKDVYSNMIVGTAMGEAMTASLAVRALNNALIGRGHPRGVIVHSDRGSQFGSMAFRRALERNGLCGSMGRVGACGDNAAMESFFALLQKNVLNQKRWTTRKELRTAITVWIETKYHRKRRQRALGKLTPIEYELVMTT